MTKFLRQCSILVLLVGVPCILLFKLKSKECPRPFAKIYIKLPRCEK